MDHMVRKNQEEKELEICISCGTETEVKKTDNVIYRSGYIEGAGQLCFKCSQTENLSLAGSFETNEWFRYGL